MSKKDKKQTAEAEELVSGASVSASGENDLPEGSEDQAESKGEDLGREIPAVGEEKGEESSENPPGDSRSSKDPEVSEEKPKIDDRRLKVSVLASGKLFAAGLKASEIDPEVVESIPSKYFEGEK